MIRILLLSLMASATAFAAPIEPLGDDTTANASLTVTYYYLPG